MTDYYEAQKLAPAIDTAGHSAAFGTAVAIAADGNTALVGAPGYDAAPGPASGAAWVYVRDGDSWAGQDTLSALTSGSDEEVGPGGFGVAVALSADGDTALVGTDDDEEGVGSATIFVRRSGAWINQHTLHALTSGSDAEVGAGQFGRSVALSADGTTALVGTPATRGGIGSATIFVLRDNEWINQHTLLGLTSGSDREMGSGYFGSSVALSADGTTALVGAPSNAGGTGSATVFGLKDNVWVNQHTLFAPTSGSEKAIGRDSFGSSVALSSDGATALVGAPADGPAGAYGTNVGAAFIFVRTANVWNSGQKLTAPTSGPDAEITSTTWGAGQFGWNVALTSDGASALISGPNDNGDIGAVWVFDYQGKFLDQPAGWYERQKLTAPTSGPDKLNDPPKLGVGLAVSGDGAIALLGGPLDNRDDEGGGDAGSVWVFDLAPEPPIK